MQWLVVLFLIAVSFRDVLGSLPDEARQMVNITKPTFSTLTTVLGAISLIKLKIMLSLITAFFVVGIISKLLGGLGTLSCGSLGIACPSGVTGYSTLNTWSQPDYSHYDSYRSQTDEPNLFNSLAKSIDIMDVSFNIFGIEEEVCKKKFVCFMDNEGAKNPFFEFILKLLGNNLTRFREQGSTATKKDCNALFPECTHGIPSEVEKEFQKPNSISEIKLQKLVN